MSIRWYRSRRNQCFILFFIVLALFYYINVSLNDDLVREKNLDITRSTLELPLANPPARAGPPALNLHSKEWSEALEALDHNNRSSVFEYIEKRLQEALKEDKGTGCEIPKLDPFAKEVTQFDKDMPKVVCQGTDWVKCYHSQCRVVKQILETTKDIVCSYSDIIYQSDLKYVVGDPTDVIGEEPYILTSSDHVKVKCTGKHKNNILPSKWMGHCVGFRSTAVPKLPPMGRERSFNVLILGFDSTARNGFIRRMPKSYRVLTEELKATVLNGYNIVGDGTPAALFPILTGKTELELPDVRRKTNHVATLDSMPFIFYKLKDDGYRTAYFEDMPWIGTFQYRFNGFAHQPADHYLRPFYLEESNSGKKWWKGSEGKYCIGDTPQYKLMLNITDQFLNLDGKRFCFTFIGDITHDDFNMISTADDDVAAFLTDFKRSGRTRDTLLMVMGDHGPRYAKVRDTIQGKLEERLPLMGIVLPELLTAGRPDARAALGANAEVLSTPHDIHATLLDVMDLRQHWNPHRIRGADRPRGMTLLEPITKNRSCSEAGVEPHWCACLAWRNVSAGDALYRRAAGALVDHINSLTETMRSKCVPRTLTSIEWVMRQRPNSGVLSFVAAGDADGYVGKFGDKLRPSRENYQIKIVVGPGKGVYEASLTYSVKENAFHVDSRDISRTNAYGNEPSCISDTFPHLNMYCYCNG